MQGWKATKVRAIAQPRPSDDMVMVTRSFVQLAEGAHSVIGEIEKRFPNWRGFRDLIDCIDCTLHELRSQSPARSGEGGRK